MNTSLDPILNELNCAYCGELGTGVSSNVYKVSRKQGSVTEYYALKVEKQLTGVTNGRKHFRAEATTLARLTDPSIVKVFAQGEYQNCNYLLMELVDGRSLDKIISEGLIKEAEVISYAKKLASGLGKAHLKGFIHRDIKPQNIIINQSGIPKLLDFGFVEIAGENRINENENSQIVGTFLYSSPEQTKMLHRPVDGRSDLYSLGIVLFECITGQLPFNSSDVGELLRKHMVEPPPRIEKIREGVSKGLQEIIYKLIAKDPDERYQTATGLVYDLELLSRNESGQLSTLGSCDKNSAQITSPIFGRDTEIASIKETITQVKGSAGAVLIIQSEPGFGKSRLLKETQHIAREIFADKLTAISAKAIKGDLLPFAPIRRVIDDYISSYVLRANGNDKSKNIEDFKLLLGDLAVVLGNFTESISKLFDGQQKSQHVSEDIYQGAIVELFIRLAKASGCMQILFDDLQWFDDASIKILRRLSGYTSDYKLIIVCASRNDEEGKSLIHQVVKDLTSINALKLNLILGPLSQNSFDEMIKHEFSYGSFEEKFLRQLFSRTNGNPYTSDEYLRSMHNAGVLRPFWGQWLVDYNELEKLALPSDIIEMAYARLSQLSEATKNILIYASILGMRFKASEVTLCANGNDELTNRAISEAIAARLIEAQGGGDNYLFVHDKIREAIVASVGGKQIQIHYQSVAEKIESKYTAKNISEMPPELTYRIANLYSKGLIEKNPSHVFDVNYRAGKVSSENYANEQAYSFLEVAQGVAQKYNLTLDVYYHQLMGEICTWTFRLKDAIEHLELAINMATDSFHRASLMGLIARCQLNGWNNTEAWKYINMALDEVNYPLPKSKMKFIFSSLGYWFLGLIYRRTKITYLLKNNDPQRKKLISLFNLAGEIAIFLNPKLLPAPAVRALFYAQLVDGDAAVVRSYATIAMLMQALGKFQISDYYHAKALALAEKMDDKVSVSEALYMRGASFSVSGKLDDFEKVCRHIRDQYQQWSEPKKFFDATFGAGWVNLMRGDTDDSMAFSEDLIKRSKSAKKSSIVKDYMSPGYNNLNLVIRGREAEAFEDLYSVKAKLEQFPPSSMAGGDCYATLLHSLFEKRDLGDEVEKIIEKLYSLAPPSFSSFPMKNGYIAILLIRIEQALGKSNKSLNHTEKIKTIVSDIVTASKGSRFYRPYICLGQAILLSFENKNEECMHLFSQSEEIAIEFANKNALYEIHRLRAVILERSGKHKAALANAEMAMNIAGSNGWVGRQKHIRETFQLNHFIDKSVEIGDKKVGTGTVVVTKEGINAKRYLDSLLQVSLAPSGIFDPQQQLEIALDEIVKVMKADRAYVFLINENSEMKFAGGRDSNRQSLVEPKGYSKTVVSKVAQDKKSIIVTGTEEGKALGSESAVVHNLRSIMAAPLLFKDQIKGVVYLDSQLAKGLFKEEDTVLLGGIASQIAITFETAKLANIEAEKRTLKKDLEVGSSVQSLFLPKRAIFDDQNVTLRGFYRPADQCGGDWWWRQSFSDGSYVIIVGDVTGHGAGPAMITASIASHFISYFKSDSMPNIYQIMESVGSQLHDFASGEYLMTAIVLSYDPKVKKITIYSAGGPSVYVISKSGEVRFSMSFGSPLGLSKECKIGQEEMAVSTLDRIFLYTDGLPEAMLSDGRMLGERRMLRILMNSRERDVSLAVEELVGSIDQMRGKQPQGDDYTCVMTDIK